MSLYPLRKGTDYIAIHCSASKASMDIGAKEINQWHRQRGFVGIGYHFVIRRNGSVETGRPVDTVGAHVEGYNSRSVGICLVGGLDEHGKSENNFTPAQFDALRELVRSLRSKYPQAVVQGHRDFPHVAKDCPCFDVKKWYAESDAGAEYETVSKELPTFYAISRKHGIPVGLLMSRNTHLDYKNLKPGDLVRLV